MTTQNFIFFLLCISAILAAVAFMLFICDLRLQQKNTAPFKQLSRKEFVDRQKQMTSGTCKYCGCTDMDCGHCIARTGEACYWINEEKNVCSACFNIIR